jgi:hypothetical protein
MAARRVSMDPGRPSRHSCFMQRCGRRRAESLPRATGVGYRKRRATRWTNAGRPNRCETPLFAAKLTLPSCCSFEQPYNKQQNHRANNGYDESADEATGEMKAQ